MKQLLQNVRTGELRLEDVPAPAPQPGGIVVRNHFSLVSVGTERATIKFARQSLLGKAKSRPDLVRQVITKARTDGIIPTYRAAMQRLLSYTPLGYSSAGEVLEIGSQVKGVEVGDLVACAGAGYACHAEVVFVPRNLFAKCPPGVSARQGAFATLGAVALQGIRRAELAPGERVAVIGLGLVGLLTVQLLQAYGFPVLGLDVSTKQVERAQKLGLGQAALIGGASPESLVRAFSQGHGVDAVIITASTASDDPIELAGNLLRERGRVSVVGDVGMKVPRQIYYDKELDLRVSRSYGPGRYDPSYEERGIDYPFAYARWTEQRNIEEFLRLVAQGQIDPESLVTHTFSVDQALEAYRLIMEPLQAESLLAVMLEYATTRETPTRVVSFSGTTRPAKKAEMDIRVGLIGAGDFAQGTMLPVLKKMDRLQVRAIATASGRSASTLARKYGCAYATTDYREILADAEINLVAIATRHGLHAQIAQEALAAGKHVFLEKPLALNPSQLADLTRAARAAPGCFTVGFNRRFAPMAQRLKEFLSAGHEPLLMCYRINAGSVPHDHWVHDLEQGGGRIIGEVCHFVDFMTFLCGGLPATVSAQGLASHRQYHDDSLIATLGFANGSVGTLIYGANGDKAMPKERLEVLQGGRSAVLDDFRVLETFRNGRRAVSSSRLGQDKGHHSEWEAFLGVVLGQKAEAIPLEELVATTLATFGMVDGLRQMGPVAIDAQSFIDAALATGSTPRDPLPHPAASGGASIESVAR